jgi:hypothetical protein
MGTVAAAPAPQGDAVVAACVAGVLAETPQPTVTTHATVAR